MNGINNALIKNLVLNGVLIIAPLFFTPILVNIIGVFLYILYIISLFIYIFYKRTLLDAMLIAKTNQNHIMNIQYYRLYSVAITVSLAITWLLSGWYVLSFLISLFIFLVITDEEINKIYKGKI